MGLGIGIMKKIYFYQITSFPYLIRPKGAKKKAVVEEAPPVPSNRPEKWPLLS